MKLCIAIVGNDDADDVAKALQSNHFSNTKTQSTGGYINVENTTFLVGVEEDKVDEVLAIIKENSSRRIQLLESGRQVTLGGATVFVVDVERFEKI